MKKDTRLVILGASGHGKVISDIAMENGYTDIVFLDDDRAIKECAGFPVVGNCSEYEKYINSDFIVAIGNSSIRSAFQKKLPNIIYLIHPNAVIGRNVKIGKGTVIMAGSVINPGAIIGEGCIINTSSSVDHDCRIGDYVHVAVGSHVAGTVEVGDHSWIGSGATVINNIKVCKQCIIGAGAVVVKDINQSGTYIGVPAKQMN